MGDAFKNNTGFIPLDLSGGPAPTNGERDKYGGDRASRLERNDGRKPRNEEKSNRMNNGKTTKKTSHQPSKKRKRIMYDDVYERQHTPEDLIWLKPIKKDVNKYKDAADFLHGELRALLNYLESTPEERATRQYVTKLVDTMVQEIWPEARVLAFGSSGTNLCLPDSDIDLVCFCKAYQPRNPNSVLKKVEKCLYRSGIVRDSVLVVAKARVPIIKFTERYSELQVDISFNQASGMHAIRSVNEFLANYKGLRELVMLVKLFFKVRSNTEVYTGGIGSYSIILMCLSFLQLHPLVRSRAIDPRENLGTLFVEFLELYRNFNSSDLVISVANGGTYLYKSDCVSWVRRQDKHQLAIQDPCNPTNDVARPTFQWHRIREHIGSAYDALISRMAEFNDAKANKEKPPNSILSAVVHVPSRMRRHRADLKQGFRREALGRAMGFGRDWKPDGEFSEEAINKKINEVCLEFAGEINEVEQVVIAKQRANVQNRRTPRSLNSPPRMFSLPRTSVMERISTTNFTQRKVSITTSSSITPYVSYVIDQTDDE